MYVPFVMTKYFQCFFHALANNYMLERTTIAMHVNVYECIMCWQTSISQQ